MELKRAVITGMGAISPIGTGIDEINASLLNGRSGISINPEYKADRDLVELRTQRNTLLSETDWTALGDVTMADKMKTYRQELRDITKTFQSMSDKDFKFPDKPES